MNNKLIIALSLIVAQAIAMELTIDNEHALSTDTTEKKDCHIHRRPKEGTSCKVYFSYRHTC